MKQTRILPQEVTNPFTPSESLLPPYGEIPEEFKGHSQNKWIKLFNDAFFCGIKIIKCIPKEGIDADKAYTHIRIAMMGWDSKHEHKEAGCAYLFSLWFEDIEWEAQKPK